MDLWFNQFSVLAALAVGAALGYFFGRRRRPDVLEPAGWDERHGLIYLLADQFALLTRYGSPFSLAVFMVDHFDTPTDSQPPAAHDRIMRELARLFDEFVRETDLVARCEGEEFAVVMPHTGLEAAGALSERLRARVRQEMPVTVCGGVTTVLDGDNPSGLLSRAAEALDRANELGPDCVYRHDGEQIESVVEEVSVATV